MTVPVFFEGNLCGMAAKTSSATQDVWLIMAPPDAHLVTLARLFAILLIGEREPVLQPSAMPSRPACAYLLDSGEMRQTRGRRLAPWVLVEVDRVADVLTSAHSSYIADVLHAPQGGTGAFASVPDDFILRDSTGRMRLGPPPPDVPIDSSQSEKFRWGLSWYQVTSQDYGRNRYMQHLTDEQLARRFEDILANLSVVNPEGRVSVDATDPEFHYWLVMFQEVNTEIMLRHDRPYPASGALGPLDRSRLPGSLDAVELTRRLILRRATRSESILVKYGQRQFVEAAYERGAIRIAPASLYNDASLNVAVRDDELTAEIDFDPSFSGIVLESDLGNMIEPHRRQTLRQKLNTNYYVYCTSIRLATRLLLDFRAEAALHIRDPDAFLQRLDLAVKRQRPDWNCIAEPVQYYDPIRVTPAEVEVLTWKHFRYAYQREFRIAWVSPKPVAQLEPIFVELGHLHDIADVCLPESISDEEHQSAT